MGKNIGDRKVYSGYLQKQKAQEYQYENQEVQSDQQPRFFKSLE